METKEILKHIKESIVGKQLAQSIHLLEHLTYSHTNWGIGEDVQNLKDTYSLMLNAVESGQKDPQLTANYQHLLREAYRLFALVKWQVRSEQNQSFAFVAGLSPIVDVATAFQRLKDFCGVQTAEHRTYVSELFLVLTNQALWTENTMRGMEELLLSEDVDVVDRQILISAIMLSAMGTFDFNKLQCLIHVYASATQAPLRVRALVGWAMALDYGMNNLYPEQKALVENLFKADKGLTEALFQIQIQLIFCLATRHDTNIVNENIMPDIINGSKTGNMPKFDIRILEEAEESDDFLEREASEQQMEELTHKAEQMMDMQKQGSDIYFGGFAVMKNFPFFNTLANWFCPFFYENPALLGVDKAGIPDSVVRGLLAAVPFCDSDKYSFALAMNMVLGKIPPRMLELLGQGEIKGSFQLMGIPEETILMRNYLQDLYRFFRLSPYRRKFVDLFAEDRFLIVANPLFQETGLPERCNAPVCRLLLKKQMYDPIGRLISSYANILEDKNFILSAAKYYMQMGIYTHAQTYYRYLLGHDEDNKSCLMGLARSCFLAEEYEDANETYERLETLYPDDWKLQLNRAICQTYIDDALPDAMTTLAKLYYEHPEEIDVVRALAWGYLLSQKLEQAQKKYLEVIALQKGNESMGAESKRSQSNQDHLHYAFTLWFDGQVSSAVDEFVLYMKGIGSGERVENVILAENVLLVRYGISETEYCLMVDLINSKL
ncbi:MAG: tetratricopeptide repeat protein [Prevotella sp.]|nr:tetratricopeptide repeat protein [Candidatus Equicola faecalis]